MPAAILGVVELVWVDDESLEEDDAGVIDSELIWFELLMTSANVWIC